jgi:HSP20 family protein
MSYFEDIDRYFKKIMERMLREMAEFDETTKIDHETQGKWNVRPINDPGVKGYVAERHFQFGGEPNEVSKPLAIPKESLEEIREPLVDIFEDKDAVKMYVELPGIEKDDIQLNVAGGHAEIKAKNFYKQAALPTKDVEVDKVSACYKNGVLQVTIPKKAKPVSEEKKTIKID